MNLTIKEAEYILVNQLELFKSFAGREPSNEALLKREVLTGKSP
ncbi:MAG: hypothetical protein ABFD08_00330 [Syntrophomonas sp.]